VFSVVSSIGANTTDDFQDLSYMVWIGALIWFIVALIIALVQYSKGSRELASGILSGSGIGIVALGITCFANVQGTI
jgi:hypothetical protein